MIWGFGLALSLLLGQDSAQTTPLNKYIYPLAKEIQGPEIVLDTTDFPEGREWMESAKGVVEEWFPKVCQLLGTDGRDPVTKQEKGKAYEPPGKLRLIIKKKISAPAYATGNSITVNGEWITKHPEDLGMMVHELTHIVQHYPDSKTTLGWLVEGIADYIRWWRYEPELHATSGRTKVNPEKAKYTDSYRTTAVWLAWSSRKYNMALVPCLDKAMRDREDPMEVFPRLTGKSADELWDEFIGTLKS